MERKQLFSERFAHSNLEKEIVVREDARLQLRRFVPVAFYELGKQPSDLRAIVCRVLMTAPDRDNWSEYPNIAMEVEQLLEDCEWFLIYDILEIIVDKLSVVEKVQFSEEINKFFIINGIGWKIVDGLLEVRGDEVFETAVKTVTGVLENAGLKTAKTEIKEAIFDLSRRPEPDITGAIQHSLACLECVTREVTGNAQSTLGELMRKYPGVIPSPLDQAVTKIWGFTSEQGRHLKEGHSPEYLEAELVVEVTAAISGYLVKKLISENKTSESEELDLPF